MIILCIHSFSSLFSLCTLHSIQCSLSVFFFLHSRFCLFCFFFFVEDIHMFVLVFPPSQKPLNSIFHATKHRFVPENIANCNFIRSFAIVAFAKMPFNDEENEMRKLIRLIWIMAKRKAIDRRSNGRHKEEEEEDDDGKNAEEKMHLEFRCDEWWVNYE